MGNVVLSTTEAEYVAISEVVKEIKFVYQLLESMDVKVPLPIKVRVDNIGAIWLVNNSGVSETTKHVDTRVHNRSLLSSGGLIADVPCLDHSLDG